MGLARRVDQVVGGLSRILHGVRGAKENTTADLEQYLDLAPEVLFPAPPSLPIVRRHRSLLSRALRRTTLSWRSTHEVICPRYRVRHEDEYRKNRTAWARWLHPRGGPQRACLVYVHGWLEPGSWAEEAALFPRWSKKLGVDLVHVSLPFHGLRNPKSAMFSGEYFWTADLVRSMEAVRQSVHDVRSMVAWLRAEGYAEVGVTGLSLGGAVVMLLACLPPVPDYVIPIIAHMQIGDAVEHAPILWRMRSDLEKWGIDAVARKRLFDRIGLARMRPILPPARQLWIEAREDVYIAAPLVLEQWERWGHPEILWLAGGHMTFPLEIDELTNRMDEFRRGLSAVG
jgi:alpha/beta hydrolase family protein